MIKIRYNHNICLEIIEMHENRVESLIIWQSRLLIVPVYICVPIHQFSKGNPANKQKRSFKGINLQLFHPKTRPTSPV